MIAIIVHCLHKRKLQSLQNDRKIRGDVAESVDATDLKSVDFLNREGSSPSIPNKKERGR